MVTLVANKENNKGYFYINGNLDTSFDISPIWGHLNTNEPHCIGAAGPHFVSQKKGSFDGVIDEVRIYNHALTESEIKALYDEQEGTCGKITNWKTACTNVQLGGKFGAEIDFDNLMGGGYRFKGIVMVRSPTDEVYSGVNQPRFVPSSPNNHGKFAGGNTLYVTIPEGASTGNYDMKLELWNDDTDELCDATEWKEDLFTVGGNNCPVLSDGKVEPLEGGESTNFVFSVTYKDEDGDEPVGKYVRIIGFHGTNKVYDETKEMIRGSGDIKMGVTYTYSTTLPAAEFCFYFYFSDGECAAYLPEGGYPGFEGPNVYGATTGNHPPSATKIEPTSDSITIEPGDTQEFKVKAEDVDEEEHNNLKMIEWFVDDIWVETDAADGTSEEASFTYTFENAGTFYVKTTVYDEQMEDDSVMWEVNVRAEPKVPYYDQGPTGWCYITSFAMIAQYWGVRVHSWDISDKCDMSVDDYTGLTWIDDIWELVGDKFSDVAEDYNLNAVSGLPIASPICDLKDEIIKPLNRQHPVIVGIPSEGHAVVVADHRIDNGNDFFYVYDPGNSLRNGRISWVSASALIGGNWKLFITEIYPKDENKEPDPPMVGLYLLPDCREIRHEWQGRMESATFMGKDGLVYRTCKDISVPGFNDLPEGELNWLRWADTHDPGMLLINDLHCSNTNDFDITTKLEITNEENNDILYTDMVTIPANTVNHNMRIELPLERIGEGNIRLKISMGGDEIGPMNINVRRPSVTGEIFTNTIDMEFVRIPAGEFEMGSPSDEEGRWKEEGPVHHVTIKNAFYMGRYEVTQKQWRAIMGDNPSYFKGDDLPVEQVSWNDVQEFIRKLNEKEGTDKYRLPSEAEWEYACRAGTTTRYSFGDSESELGDYAWYDDNSDDKTHPVGQKKPNPWGLYDMHGNVWEWVQDKWHGNYDGAPADGSAWVIGDADGSAWVIGDAADRVIRSGCRDYHAGGCRSAFRFPFAPRVRYDDLGFRILQEV